MKLKNIFSMVVCVGLILASCAPNTSTPNTFDENEQEDVVEDVVTDSPSQDNNNSTEVPSVSNESEFVFDPSRVNRNLPNDINDIVEEALFYGQGGGGGEDPCQGINSPTIISEWFDVEQLENAWVLSCGWEDNKDVSATLFGPDGITLLTESIGPWSGSLYWSFLPTAFDPTGQYEMRFSDDEQTLDFMFNVSRITKSGAVLLYAEKEIQVYNFSPREKIRLFIYSSSSDGLEFEGWQGLTVNADGKLLIKLTELDYELNYAVVGEETGEFHLTIGFGQSILKINTPVLSNSPLCSGAPLSKVAVGSTARVTFTDGTPTRIRKQPTTSSNIVGRLSEGTRFLIIGGHECSDGFTWWRIELPNGASGWMAEGKGGTYYLEPMNYLQQTCSYPVSRLSLGDQAQVAKVDGSNTRLRSQPGFSQSIVGKVPEGTSLTILDGPECVDGNNWWYVRTKNGLEGWMTEAQNGVYLIEPMP
jgi:hypothetical protein